MMALYKIKYRGKDPTKERWLVIEWLMGEIRKPQRALVTTFEDPSSIETIYWSGGISHCGITGFHDLKVAKDYGVLTEDEQGDIYDRYNKEFPPMPYDWGRPGECPQGFLSPDGTLYAGDYMDHSSLADDLMHWLDIEDTYDNEGGLHNAGFLTVRFSLIVGSAKWKVTPAQVRTLERLVKYTGREQVEDAFKQFYEIYDEKWPTDAELQAYDQQRAEGNPGLG
jgi:hypothetical protein